MYKISEQFEVGLYINGQEFPLEAGNALNLVHIMTSTKVMMPVMHLQFTDALGLAPKFGLTDGSPVSVTIKSAVTVTRDFRIYKWSRMPSGTGFAYTLDCYYDAPKYWAMTSLAGIRGSSYSAISQIADMTGLTMWTKSAETADNMLWLPANKTYGAFARTIARYGYRSDESHMVLALDTEGDPLFVAPLLQRRAALCRRERPRQLGHLCRVHLAG